MVRKKTAQKRKVSAIAARMRAALEAWHRGHEFDLARMMEENPKLFHALLAEPSLFKGSEIGEKYSRLVTTIVSKAEKTGIYKEAFVSPREGIHPKDKLSIGRLLSSRKLERRGGGKH